MDLEDLLDDNIGPSYQKKPAVNTPKQSVYHNRQQSQGVSKNKLQDLDDLNEDSFDLDDNFGKKPSAVKPYENKSQANKVANLWGGTNGNVASTSKINTSFGGSNKGSLRESAVGSRKSKLEEEADEFDNMLDAIDGGQKLSDPVPTGTFRGDGWDDDKFIKSKPSQNLQKKKFTVEEDFDVDNLLDDLEEKKGIESSNQRNRPKTAHNQTNSLWSAGGGFGGNASSRNDLFDEDLDKLEELEDPLEKDERNKFSAGKNKFNQRSDDQILERKKALFGDQKPTGTASTGGLTPLAANTTQAQSRNQRHAQSQETEKNLDSRNSNSTPNNAANINFHDTKNSGGGSQDSGIEVIETANSRVGARKRMMQRPPTSSGPQGSQDQSSHSPNQQQRANTGGQSRPPLGSNMHAGSLTIQTPTGAMMPRTNTADGFGDSQGSYQNNHLIVQASNLNFQPRTVQNQQHFAGTNFMSDVDFERANTDIEDEIESSEYYEEEVTDQEAMAQINNKEDQDTDDSDLGFYMPTVLAKKSSDQPKKTTTQKITKKVRRKKQKPIKQIKPPKNQKKPQNFGGVGAPIVLENQRKSATMQDSNMMASNPGYSNPVGSMISGGGIIQANSQMRMLESMDEKQILQYEIEQIKDKIRLREENARQEMDNLRSQHQKAIQGLQHKQEEKLLFLEKEKIKLIEDKTRTIDLEKKKLAQLQKIDTEQRDVAHKKGLESQKELYAEQHDSLRKQLQQKRQMNQLAEEINKNSSQSYSAVQKLSAEQKAELQRREEEILIREQAMAARKRAFNEKKIQLEQQKRKLQSGFDEITQRERETATEYESEKQEIFNDIDEKDISQQEENRRIRNRTIDLEVEHKRILTDIQRVNEQKIKEQKEVASRKEEITIELKQIGLSRQAFRLEIQSTEKELRIKLDEVEQFSRNLALEERDYHQREIEFEEENRRVQQVNDALQEQLDRFNIDKENFDRRAMVVKEQGELDQLDSEKIGFFKANKERIRDELRKLKTSLEDDKISLAEDRIKLEIFKTELKTKQKAIETMRYEYIKSTSQDNMMHFADQAKELAMFKLQMDNNDKQMYPIMSFNSPTRPSAAPPASGYEALLLSKSSGARFNYNDYMKTLNDKLTLQAPQTCKLVGATFQEFVMKERQYYLVKK